MSRHVRDRLLPPDAGVLSALAGVAGVTPTTRRGVCVFLRGTIHKRVSCRIYDTRPDVCRTFRPGSSGCLQARTSGIR